MASAFWKYYASVTDDIRHKVIEEGWYQRHLTSRPATEDIDPNALAGTGRNLFAELRGKEPQAADLYGQPAAQAEQPRLEAPTIENGEPTHPAIEPPDDRGIEPEI